MLSSTRRAVAIGAAAIVLAACGTDTPSPSSVQPSVTASTAPSQSSAPTGDGPPACLDAKLVWADALDRLLLAGCLDQLDQTSVETVWAWDGSTWEQLSDDGPPGHVVSGMAWDTERDVLVRYGGIPLPSQECSPETWEWDTTAWRQVDADPPEACDHIEVAADPSAGRLLMVGGGRTQDLMLGTWAWDGTTWSDLTDAGPPPRAHHAVVTAGDGVLLYGGLDITDVLGDMWAWDGSAWQEADVDGDGPGPRSHHGMAIGSAGALLFGGATSTSTFASLVDESWLLAGGAWSLLDGAGPSARGLPALGYDPDREVYVLYGGFDAQSNPLADTWEFNGVSWSCVAGC